MVVEHRCSQEQCKGPEKAKLRPAGAPPGCNAAPTEEKRGRKKNSRPKAWKGFATEQRETRSPFKGGLKT